MTNSVKALSRKQNKKETTFPENSYRCFWFPGDKRLAVVGIVILGEPNGSHTC